MTRILVLAAATTACLSLAAGVPGAAAVERPTLADDVAARLGVTPEQLQAAFRAVLTARVDAAVTAGRLTPEQGARLKERIANANGLGLGVKRGFAKKQQAFGKRLGLAAKRLGAAADHLGLTRAELRAELRSGKSLAQVAAGKGKSVDGLVAAILAPVKERLAKAVAARRLTQERADELLERLTKRVEARVDRTRAAG